MVTLQTIIVYTLLFFIMLFLAKRASEKGEWIWMVLAILIYSLVFGMRYGVGVDHISYLHDYLRITNVEDSQYAEIEFGYRVFRDTLSACRIHFSLYFGLIAFLQLWLIFKAVKSDTVIYPYLVIAFFLGCVWLSYSNGLRQQMAFCLFAYSLLFIDNKKQLPKHYLLLLLALSLHQSTMMLFVVAPLLIFLPKWFSNRPAQYIALAVSLVVGVQPQVEQWLMSWEDNMGSLNDLMEDTGYNSYFDYDDGDHLYQKPTEVGIGYYVELLRNIVLIWFSNEVIKYNSHNKVVGYMYNFTYLGILLHYLFITSLLAGRVNYYFYGFAYIFGAYTLHYLYNKNKKMFWVLCSLYLLTFVGTLYRMYDNTSAFYFFWQSGLYGK